MKHFRSNSLRRARKDSEKQSSEKQAAIAAAAAEPVAAPPLSPSMTTEYASNIPNHLPQLSEDRLEAPAFAMDQSSRRSSANSSRKPLSGIPSPAGSPMLNPKTSANLRQQAMASSIASSLSSQIYSKPASNASNASENWTAPEDSEGAYIRKTYAHFDASGIRGDGMIEGKEWTRERSARAAWDASEGTKNVETPSNLAPPSNGHETVRSRTVVKKTSSPLSQSDTPLRTNARDSPGPYGEGRSECVTPTFAALTVQEPLSQSSSSLGSHSIESAHESNHKEVARAEGDYELEAERKELMKNVDRYGFFTKEGQSGRARITILPADVLQIIPKRRRPGQRLRKGGRGSKSSDLPPSHSHSSSADDPYQSGSEKASTHQAMLHSIMQSRDSKDMALREREALRVAKWDRMLQVTQSDEGISCYALATNTIKTKKLRKRVYKGVPDRWRSAAWWAILLGLSEKGSSLSFAEANYRRLLLEPSPHDVQIDLDVPRTISGHVLFHTRYGQGQRSLFHVLHAFSMLCPQCAYCQGMGPIAATLLVYFTPEKAYAVLVELHNRSLYGLHSTFSPGFPGLVENFYVQKKLCMKLCPDIMESLEANGIVISSYATKWYITLFTNVLPFSTQLRLWDCFLLQGKDLLVVIAIAILWSLQKELLSGGFETAMNLLTREFLPVDDDALLNWIFVVMEREDTIRVMRDARKEYRSLVKQGKEPVL